MTGPGTVWVVLPGDVDDPATPSGGNVYDRRICQGLGDFGVPVRELTVAGEWPRPGEVARERLTRGLRRLPDGAVTLIDGLVACGVPEIVVPETRRLRVAVLVHLPLAAETGLPPGRARELAARERATLHAATAVFATSAWAGRDLVARHGLDPARVHVVPPGADPAPLAPGTDGASRLLCVAAVTPRKGHDLLVRALGSLTGLPWSCECVGALRDPGHAARLRALITDLGLDGRVRLAGPRTGDALAARYAAADLTVLASRAETYGMVIAESLARGVPVLATAAGAVPETLGVAPDGDRPGLLVPPEDPAALAHALRRWLTEPALRERLRAAARARRATLDDWTTASGLLAALLTRLRQEPRA